MNWSRDLRRLAQEYNSVHASNSLDSFGNRAQLETLLRPRDPVDIPGSPKIYLQQKDIQNGSGIRFSKCARECFLESAELSHASQCFSCALQDGADTDRSDLCLLGTRPADSLGVHSVYYTLGFCVQWYTVCYGGVQLCKVV